MSVLVKGMKMPESCYYCGLADTSFINCMAFEKPILLEDDCEERRPDWCPLVALPDKHGDLIDRDAFRADYGMNADCADCEKECQGKTRACEYDRIYTKMDFCSWLDVADVVIEAEDSE